MAGFKSRMSNLWYHYKVQILFGIFLIGTLIFCLQSCISKPKYDLEVYFVVGSDSVYTEQVEWIRSSVAQHCPDANGDGEITVAVTPMKVGNGTSPSDRAEYMNAVQAGTVMLFFANEEGIEYLYNNGYLQPLNDYSETLWAADCAWEVTGSPFASAQPGFEVFDGMPLYAALRVYDGTWSSARRTVRLNFETAQTTLHSIIDSCRS